MSFQSLKSLCVLRNSSLKGLGWFTIKNIFNQLEQHKQSMINYGLGGGDYSHANIGINRFALPAVRTGRERHCCIPRIAREEKQTSPNLRRWPSKHYEDSKLKKKLNTCSAASWDHHEPLDLEGSLSSRSWVPLFKLGKHTPLKKVYKPHTEWGREAPALFSSCAKQSWHRPVSYKSNNGRAPFSNSICEFLKRSLWAATFLILKLGLV